MSEPVVIFEDVSKWYPLYHQITGGIKRFLFRLPEAMRTLRDARFHALNRVSFSVYKGETFGIIGGNGAGKSTTMGLMAGVLRPSKGSVMVKGRVAPLLELGAGFHQELSGRENIELNGVLLGLSRKQVFDRLDSIVSFAEIGGYIDQPIRTYSSGMLVRLGFAVAVHLDPKILLIDEVLAVGDMEFQKKCKDRMASFKGDGVTMVLVSHSMEEVVQLCDRVMWIEDHCVRRIGPATEVVEAYTRSVNP
jgi:lipopolysaccharide transport system ATP-binding protein